jgi:hypothetical protein
VRRCNTFAEGEHETIYWARIAVVESQAEKVPLTSPHRLAEGQRFSEELNRKDCEVVYHKIGSVAGVPRQGKGLGRDMLGPACCAVPITPMG